MGRPPTPYLLKNNAHLRKKQLPSGASNLAVFQALVPPVPSSLGFYLYIFVWVSWYGFSFCHLQLRVLTYNAQKFCSLFSGYLWTSWRNPSLKLYPWSSNMGPLFKAILPSVNMNSYPGKHCHKLFHLVAFVYLIDHIQLLQLRFNSNNHNIFIFIDIFILVLYLTTLGLERVNNIF